MRALLATLWIVGTRAGDGRGDSDGVADGGGGDRPVRRISNLLIRLAESAGF